MAVRLIRPAIHSYVGFAIVSATFCLAVAFLGQGGWSDEEQTAPRAGADSSPSSDQTNDPLSVNASCYVCHIMFVREEISRVHFNKKITCVQCHGVSAAHANDEDIGATKPDITYRRDQVDFMCSKCHKSHDVAPRQVIAAFLAKKPKSWPVVCTDCHGHHRIEKPEESAPVRGQVTSTPDVVCISEN
jgi:hypothetical protein